MILKSFSEEDWEDLKNWVENNNLTSAVNWNLLRTFVKNPVCSVGPLSNQIILAFSIPFKAIPTEMHKSGRIWRKALEFRLSKGI